MDKTVQYKRTLRGSVGAGVGALLNGSGRRYYILEHRDASKYHKAGESQKIIIDQIEIGRDANCQVRFDESFSTVSRRHAAIVKDGDRWKLVQLSKTNSTLLNGRKVETEWYLENGDEIQLSVGGPRMGFIVPEGKQSLVSSIKMTERLELFRKQALKPYKTAIVAMFVSLIVLGCGAGYVIYNQDLDIKDLMAKTENQATLMAEVRKQHSVDSVNWIKERDSLLKLRPKTVIVRPDPGELTTNIDKMKPSVFAVITNVYIENEREKASVASGIQGTGFLLSDGRFVTARHCVEPWLFDITTPIGKQMQAMYALANTTGIFRIYAEIVAYNMDGLKLSFKSTDFKIDRSYDSPIPVDYELNGEKVELQGAVAFGTKASLGNDWAYVRTSQKGTIVDGRSLSDNLKSGSTVHLLGFPRSLGIADGDKIVEPIYNSMNIARDGLNDGRCIMVSQGVDHGNSGGPVFVMNNGQLRVIGIVSRGDSKSDLYNHLVPMSNLK